MENETVHTGEGLLSPAHCAHKSAHADDGYCPECGSALRPTQAQPRLSPQPGLPLGKLIPLRTWWEDRSWRTGVPFAFLALALLPFLIDHLSFGHAKWGFAAYFAGIWLLAIRALVKPETVSHWRVAGIVLFTAVVGIPLAIALETHAGMSSSFIHNIFAVGLPEELTKALPVFLFVFLVRRFHLTPRTYMYLGAVSGLAFGAVEAVHYSDLYAMLASFDSTTLMTEVWRLVSGPVLHACMAGISCYFIGLASTHRNRQVPLIGFGLAIAALLHGAYDTTTDSWMGVAVTAVIIFIFVGYVLSAERIADDYRSVADQTPIRPADAATSWSTHGQTTVTSRPGSGQSTSHIGHNVIEHDHDAYGDPRPAASSRDDNRRDGSNQLASAPGTFAGASK